MRMEAIIILILLFCFLILIFAVGFIAGAVFEKEKQRREKKLENDLQSQILKSKKNGKGKNFDRTWQKDFENLMQYDGTEQLPEDDGKNRQ